MLSDQGKLGEAEPLCREALAARKEALGERHPSTLSSMNSLAVLLRKQGKLGEAEPLFREALAAMKEALGERHPDTLTSMNNLAILLRDQGKLGEAELLAVETLAANVAVFGDGHSKTVDAHDLLDGIRMRQGFNSCIARASPSFWRRGRTATSTACASPTASTSSASNLSNTLTAANEPAASSPAETIAARARRWLLQRAVAGNTITFIRSHLCMSASSSVSKSALDNNNELARRQSNAGRGSTLLDATSLS